MLILVVLIGRIRLNNVIWRAYYLEFRKPGKKRKAPYCYFSVPDDDTTHTKIEVIFLDNMLLTDF